MNTDEEQIDLGQSEDAVPLCLTCLRPVNPLAKVCPQCGGAVGQLTPYLPLESVRWEADVWGRMWEQVWRRDISLLGRVFRFVVIALFAPILLLGFIPMIWRKLR